MIKEVIMPKLGQTMEEGIIEKWRKKEGEKVEKGDILLDITTDKATLEVESYASGILRKIIHCEGETVPVSQVIAYIGEEDDDVPVIESTSGRMKASPAARRIARENKIDLSLIKGTGPGGRIVEKDVAEFMGKKGGGSKAGRPLSGIRRIISERMSRSKREIPHYYLSASIDMKDVIRIRKEFNQKFKDRDLKVSYNDFLIKAAGIAVKEFPSFNMYLEDNLIKERDSINIGLAVSIPEGIIVPVIRNADKLSFFEIVKERQGLVEKARTNKLTPDEYSGGSFTISNLGAYEIESFCAIINPPESAILAVGSIADTPAVVNGEISIRPVMKVTLSLDHRIIDGAIGAQFLQRIKELVETPENICGGGLEGW